MPELVAAFVLGSVVGGLIVAAWRSEKPGPIDEFLSTPHLQEVWERDLELRMRQYQ